MDYSCKEDFVPEVAEFPGGYMALFAFPHSAQEFIADRCGWLMVPTVSARSL